MWIYVWILWLGMEFLVSLVTFLLRLFILCYYFSFLNYCVGSVRRVIFPPMLSCYENFLISVTIEVLAEIRVFLFESHSHHLCASSSWIWRRSLLIFSILKCNFAEHDSTLGPWTAPPSAFSNGITVYLAA